MEQARNIPTAILEFYQYRLANGPEKFYIGDLQYYVAARMPEINQDSVDRVLRRLRLQNKINYVVLNRNASLYQVLPVSEGNA